MSILIYIDSLTCKRGIYGLERSSYKNMPAFLMYLKIRANIYQIEFVLSTCIKLHLHVLKIFLKFTVIMLDEKYCYRHKNAFDFHQEEIMFD